MAASWKDEAKVGEYVARVGRLAARQAGEVELVEALPERVGRVLDVGCGDGQALTPERPTRPTSPGSPLPTAQ